MSGIIGNLIRPAGQRGRGLMGQLVPHNPVSAFGATLAQMFYISPISAQYRDVAVASDGTIFVAADDGRILHLTAGGVVISIFTASVVLKTHSIALDETGGVIYGGQRNGYMFKVRISDGSILWEGGKRGNDVRTLVFDDNTGRLYGGSTDHPSIFRLDPDDGSLIWERASGPFSSGDDGADTAILSNGDLFVLSTSFAQRYSPTGDFLGEWPLPNGEAGGGNKTLDAFGGKVAFATTSALYLYDEYMSAQEWRVDLGERIYGVAFGKFGDVYAFSDPGRAALSTHRLSGDDGSVVWFAEDNIGVTGHTDTVPHNVDVGLSGEVVTVGSHNIRKINQL